MLIDFRSNQGLKGSGVYTVDIGGGIFETTRSIIKEIILETCQGLEGNWILSLDVLTTGTVQDYFRGNQVHDRATSLGTRSTGSIEDLTDCKRSLHNQFYSRRECTVRVREMKSAESYRSIEKGTQA